MARLFDGRRLSPEAFATAGADFALLVTQEPEFEDKLFEILCLGWAVQALGHICSEAAVDLTALKGRHDRAVFKGRYSSGWSIEVFFQRSADALPKGRWTERDNGRSLRGIPDLLLHLQNGADQKVRLIIVDAKNRSIASESEVAYKLLGYKENFGLEEYLAIGLYPRFDRRHRIRVLSKGDEHITLLHVPLQSGLRTVRAALRGMMIHLPLI